MDHPPDDPSHRLTYLNAISALIDGVGPADQLRLLAAEKATAKRLFMILAQTQVPRCEPADPLSDRRVRDRLHLPVDALYFAKLFGVEDKVEISLLFETWIGLERGAEVIAEALAVDSFRAYVRAQGRLHIQTGFSDAGRYLGQIAAAHAIERLRMAVGRVLAERACARSSS